jgi:excisionase family DNA binding protein
MGEQYYTVEEVAQQFKVSDQTVRNWIKKGRLQAIQVASVIRIPESAINDFLASSKQEADLVRSSH